MTHARIATYLDTVAEPRRPLRRHPRPPALQLGEILRNAATARDIADAIALAAGQMEIAQTRCW